MDILVAQGDGFTQCVVCGLAQPIRDGERAQRHCDAWPAIYDEAYWKAVRSMDHEREE